MLIKGSSITIKSNSITGGGKYGVYLTGNKATIVSNTISSNGADGIYLIGSNAEISKNIIKSNKERGIYYSGSNSKIISNSINNNIKNGINGKGNSNIFTSNKIIKNSPRKSYCAVYFDGNSNTYKSNNISSNDYHGLHIVGKGNKLINNYLEKNKNTQIIVGGNKNTITGNKAYNGKNYGLYILGSTNTLSKNIISKNKNGIIIKGKSNQLISNFIQYCSNYGVYLNGSKNKIIQNTIRGNNYGIYHKIGSSDVYNYNYIVNNKKYNLYRDTGSLNANYNWWGENKVVKVKNEKISRYVVAKLVIPKVNYLKPNKTYEITFILVNDKNKKLNKVIPSTKAKFEFLRKFKDKWYSTLITPKNKTLLNNKATVKIKTVNAYRVYNFKAIIDNQKLSKIFYPPSDLKLWIVPSPNPGLQGSIITYNVYIQNNGPGDAYNVTFSSKNLNIKYVQYSFDGKKWTDWKGSLKISKIQKNKIQRVYITGILHQKLKGKVKITGSVKSNTFDLNKKDNKYSFTLKIIPLAGKKLSTSSKSYSYCGASVLQQLLASKGIYVDKNKLIKELKPKKGQISLYMMVKIAEKYGLKLYAEKVAVKNLKKDDTVLLNISGNTHYVTIISMGKDTVTINDPSLGPITISKSDFKRWYTGYALSTEKKGKALSVTKQKNIKGGILPLIIFAGVALVVIASSLGVVHARRLSTSYRPNTDYYGYYAGRYYANHPRSMTGKAGVASSVGLAIGGSDLYNSYASFSSFNWSGKYPKGFNKLIKNEPAIARYTYISAGDKVLYGGKNRYNTWTGYHYGDSKTHVGSSYGWYKVNYVPVTNNLKNTMTTYTVPYRY